MKQYKVLPQVLVAIAVNVGPLIYGISLGWSAPAGPILLDSKNDFVMTANEFSWSVSVMPLGGALSCVISGLVRNRYGTKCTMLTFGIFSILGWLSLIFGWNPSMIIIGRILIGIAGGAYCFNIPIFIGEFASKEIRGILLTLFQVFVKLGVVLVYTLGSITSLFVLNIICGSVAVIYTICFTFIPETPAFLIRNGKVDKAEKSIKLLRGENYDAKQEISYAQKAYDEALNAPKSSFLIEFKKRATFKAFVIIILLFVFFQMSGINAVIFYTTTIFIEAGVQMNPSLATIILGVVQVLSTLLTAAFIDSFGRVFLLTTSFSLMIIGHIGFGVFFLIRDIQVISWLPLPSLCLVCIGFSAGLGSVPFILLGEIFSGDAKKVIAPFAQTMNFVMSFMIGILYPALVSMIGTGLTFFMFAGFCIVGLLFTIFFIPETKGKSLQEIQSLLSN